ncbi:hypothetical protein CDD83_3903 [Cordyceps sp. RAO-2017]|nr:hypothetical protein CDD83_3903 [Cordyceps sp. RAO-2017]
MVPALVALSAATSPVPCCVVRLVCKGSIVTAVAARNCVCVAAAALPRGGDPFNLVSSSRNSCSWGRWPGRGWQQPMDGISAHLTMQMMDGLAPAHGVTAGKRSPDNSRGGRGNRESARKVPPVTADAQARMYRNEASWSIVALRRDCACTFRERGAGDPPAAVSVAATARPAPSDLPSFVSCSVLAFATRRRTDRGGCVCLVRFCPRLAQEPTSSHPESGDRP